MNRPEFRSARARHLEGMLKGQRMKSSERIYTPWTSNLMDNRYVNRVSRFLGITWNLEEELSDHIVRHSISGDGFFGFEHLNEWERDEKKKNSEYHHGRL